jgi:hypothetical protein
MTGHSTFNWSTLGKADYAQASALVSSLPEEHRSKLVNGVRETLTRIVFLSWKQSEHSGRGSAYCWPSEAWLAKAIGRSERTVRRCLTILSKAGLLTWRRRSTKGGAWTSNLYQVGKTFLASLFARGKKKVQSFRDRTKMADNDLKREYKAAPITGEPATMHDLLGLHRVQPIEPLGAAQSEDAADDWGQDSYEVRRRAELKSQKRVAVRAEPEGEW